MFKVVPDQLRVSDGWVRCGQCDEVFDANVHMQSDIQIAKGPASARKDVWGVSLPEESQDIALPGAYKDLPVHGAQEESIHTVTANAADPEPGPAPWEPEAKIGSESLPVQEPAQTDAFSANVAVDEVQQPTPPAEPWNLQAQEQEVNKEGDAPKLSFMRPTSVPSVWSKPLVRAGLAALCILLGGVLLLQVIIQERDRIAATEPGTRPFLVSVCALWGCEVSPLRQIDSVVIDSSSFVKVRADVYRLNFTLKNNAKIHIATPALELSLTDMKDLPAIRRVISAPEFTPQQELMGPDAEFSASLPISVKLPAGAERISGYRLMAFYP